MTLLDYLKTIDTPAALERLAARCGTTPAQLRQVAYGRRVSVELAVRIDRGTDGAVPCWALRPDVDWDYVRHALAAGA